MTIHEFDVHPAMTPELEAAFRADHGLSEDEDLGPHMAREAQNRLREAGLFGGGVVYEEEFD
ncbi:hypothetical protein [Nocardiopsis sp. CA-288880]|uniref:hypothetical protein n=1 Tax=Nocardiopsis sp. CA-288880 TaxID=3239995 RepID=UPI003D95F550